MAQHLANDVDDPWADAPTVMAPPCYESARLDAAALFADLDLGALQGSSQMLPPPSAMPLAPMFAASTTIPVPVFEVRRDVVTVRSRRPPPMDPQRARALAFLICSSLALIAALASCFLYSAAPRHQAPKPTAPAL